MTTGPLYLKVINTLTKPKCSRTAAIGPYHLPPLLCERRQRVTLQGEVGDAVEAAPHGHQLTQDFNHRERDSVLWNMQEVACCKSQLCGSCCGNHTFLKLSWQIKQIYTITPIPCT